MWQPLDELLKQIKRVPEYFRSRGMPWVVSRATFIVAALCTVALGVNKVGLPNRFTDWVGAGLGSLKMTAFLWLLTCISGLYKRQTEVLENTRKLIGGALSANEHANNLLRNVATTMDLHVRAGSIFDHSSVVGDEAGLINRRSFKSHHSLNYISIHCEVTYYSMVCSLLESKKNEIEEISRAHAFFPHTPAAMFLPEMLDLLSNIKAKCNSRVYLFSNDVLDYDRDAMSNEKVTEGIDEHGQPRQRHLWSAFAKASHVLFRDDGAYYGFLKPTRSKSIWKGDEKFHGSFYETFERILLKCKDGTLAFIVKRDPDTFEFRGADIVTASHHKELVESTEDYFKRLMSKVGDGLYSAGDWEGHKVEVALVSGEVMESYAGTGITLWAVDDFPVEEQKTGPQAIALQRWDIPGSTRDIAWTKSVVAALKGARIRRVFLIDDELFQNPAHTKSLFIIMATQHLFLTPREGFSPLREHDDWGDVKLQYRSGLSKAEAQTEGYPDLALMTRTNDGVEMLLGGVIVQPEAIYLIPSHPHGPDWKQWVEDLWQKSEAFPKCFSSVKKTLAMEVDDIAKQIVEREELNLARHHSFEKLRTDLQEWLRQTIDKL